MSLSLYVAILLLLKKYIHEVKKNNSEWKLCACKAKLQVMFFFLLSILLERVEVVITESYEDYKKMAKAKLLLNIKYEEIEKVFNKWLSSLIKAIFMSF